MNKSKKGASANANTQSKSQASNLKALLYCRTVQLDNSQSSIKSQESALKCYCKEMNIEVMKVFVDISASSNFNRPGYLSMLDYLDNTNTRGQIDVILFTTWDRFSNDTSEAIQVIHGLNERGIVLNAIEQMINPGKPISKEELVKFLSEFTIGPDSIPPIISKSENLKQRKEDMVYDQLAFLLSNLPVMFINERKLKLPECYDNALEFVMNDDELVRKFVCYMVGMMRSLAFEPGEMQRLIKGYYN